MEIKDMISKSIETHMAHGYKYRVYSEAPKKVIEEMKKEWKLPDNLELDPDEVFNSIGGFCSYKEEKKLPEYADDIIYIFVDGIKKSAEKFKEMIHMPVEQRIEFCVIHECRHSQQVMAIREAGMNPDSVFQMESDLYSYGMGPMEVDANSYAMSIINGTPYEVDASYPLKYMNALIESKAVAEENERETFEMSLNYY